MTDSLNPFSAVDQIKATYRQYVSSFQKFKNPAIREWVDDRIGNGTLLVGLPARSATSACSTRASPISSWPFPEAGAQRTWCAAHERPELKSSKGVLENFRRKSGGEGSEQERSG